MKELSIYLAHQITGLSYEEVVSYYENVTKILTEFGYKIYCPMTGKSYLRTEDNLKNEGYKFPTSTDHAIKERDKWMVSQSDVVLTDLTGMTRVSVGCMMELAWADLLGKHTIVVMEKDNPHRHAFVLECADIVFETLPEALAYLKNLSEGNLR